MIDFQKPNIYENLIFELEEGFIRPGGLSLTGSLVKACGFRYGDRVVDIGCGTGKSVEFLCDQFRLNAAGIDLSGLLLGLGKKRTPYLHLIQAAGGALPFADSTINGLIAECSLSVMNYSDWILAEMHRILTPGARLGISDIYIRNPDFADALRNIPCTGCVSGALTHFELTRKLEDNGFRVLGWEDQSVLLKEFAAHLIMENGSLNVFWQSISCAKEEDPDLRLAIKNAKIGYLWLAAEKNID